MSSICRGHLKCTVSGCNRIRPYWHSQCKKHRDNSAQKCIDELNYRIRYCKGRLQDCEKLNLKEEINYWNLEINKAEQAKRELLS